MDVNKLEANTSYREIEDEIGKRFKNTEIEDEIDKRFKNFKNFDIISDPPSDHQFDKTDHQFHKQQPPGKLSLFPIIRYMTKKLHPNKTKPSLMSQINWDTKKLQQEWKVLETNLPNSILVRAYKNRIDLMRAVILGPPNTPYDHCLFFFDIVFPSNYPNCPPKLFYLSQGLDLNHQSVQSDGTVFLSLLETGGDWDPKQSNLLQVLVSIQRLVLNSKPPLSESEEQEYNRNALMFTSKAIVQTLKRPPGDFEDFVAGHFRQRAHAILMNYKERMDESKGMTQLFIKLLRALETTGAYCKHHLNQAILEKASREERSKNAGILSRVFTKGKNQNLAYSLP